MKRMALMIWAILLVSVVGSGFGQEPIIDRVSVAFSDPSKPGTLEVGLVSGGITVTGYDGKEVTIEAVARTKKLSTDRVFGRTTKITSEKSDVENKAKGMQKIQVTTTGLSVEEENNAMEISVESWKRAIDLTIKVPIKTSLNLSCVNNGNISVENVEGDIEVNNTNGAISLKNISGSVVAHALNKDVVVSFNRVNPNKNMSFTSLNGDIDITFPNNLKATVKLKSTHGDIYSDFDISQQEVVKDYLKEDKRKEGGKYRISFESGIQVKINGGGPEITFKTFNGDVFIRKGK